MKKPYFLHTALIPPHPLLRRGPGRGLLLLLFLLPLFTTAQVIVTCAGTGVQGYTGDGHPANDAELYYPYGVVLDDSGNLYICDADNACIRKVSNPANVGVGIITTIAGNGTGGYSGDHGLGTNAQLDGAYDVAIDRHGNVYIADAGNNCIRKVTPLDTITTIAGNGTAGYNGDTIPAITALLNSPTGITVDSIGNLYIADGYNYRIRKIDATGIITTIAGTGILGYSPDGSHADTAKLDGPYSIRIDKKGNIFFSDGARIRKMDTSGIITTIAGNGTIGYSGDSGLATAAEIGGGAIAIDSIDNLYISDGNCDRIRKVDTAGIIYTIAGSAIGGYGGDGGNPLLANLCGPQGIAVGSSGDVYIGDVCNNRVRLVVTYPVAIKDIVIHEFGISIYPNPAVEKVNIESNFKGRCAIIITDVLGRSIYKDSFTNKIQIPVANWQPGVYYVQVMSENGYKEVQKLIVQ